MDEYLEFYIEKTKDGYIARSFGACIMTEAATIPELKAEIAEALCCHFDEGCKPVKIKLRYVDVTKEETING